MFATSSQKIEMSADTMRDCFILNIVSRIAILGGLGLFAYSAGCFAVVLWG